jgi:hypothetical protein
MTQEVKEKRVQASVWLSEKQYRQLVRLTTQLKMDVARGISQSDLISFALDELFKAKNQKTLEAKLRDKYSKLAW